MSVFKAWHTYTTRECLSRLRVNERVAADQAQDLEMCQETIRELRGKLAAMTEQVKVLVDENSRLKMGEAGGEAHAVVEEAASALEQVHAADGEHVQKELIRVQIQRVLTILLAMLITIHVLSLR